MSKEKNTIIPLHEKVGDRLDLIALEPERTWAVLSACYQRFSRKGLHWADHLTKPFLACNSYAYNNDICRMAEALDNPGVFALNASFEWGCTAGVKSQQIFRVLDWPLKIGHLVAVARYETGAGPYYDINWPGYVGVLNGIAPNRFAAAINQAPMARNFYPLNIGLAFDWFLNRLRVRKNRDWLPSHLLRSVFENCANYEEAKNRLIQEPLCIPAIFSLVGAGQGEHCIIERMEKEAVIHDGEECVSNHWKNNQFIGRPRWLKTVERLNTMTEALPNIQPHNWDWLTPPILNSHTLMAFTMDFKTGLLRIRGFDGSAKKAVTETLEMVITA